MDTKGRLVAGSHNRNEFVVINANDIGRVTSVKELTGQICEICGDEIEFSVDGEPFVICNECAFPICIPCYEYERREGNRACPQCKTRYKRLKGSPRVDGDEDEDEFDDLEHEFDYNDQQFAEAALYGRNNIRRSASGITNQSEFDPSTCNSEIPLLTYGQEDDTISADKHALIIPLSQVVGIKSILCYILIPPCHCHHGQWTLIKTWPFMAMGRLPGRKEWRNGRKSRMIFFKWLSIKEIEVVATSLMILIFPIWMKADNLFLGSYQFPQAR